MSAAKLQLVESDSSTSPKKSSASTKRRVAGSPRKASSKTAPAGASEKTPPNRKKAAPSASAPKKGRASAAEARTAGKTAAKSAKRSVVAADLMSTEVACCRPTDTLNVAAQSMWERDLGALVVVDDGMHPIGLVTDRDLCMGAYTQGVPLAFSQVASTMSKKLVSCQVGASVQEVRALLATHQLRRLPVVDDSGVLVGVIGLSDIALEASRKLAPGKKRGTSPTELLELTSAVLAPPSADLLASRAS